MNKNDGRFFWKCQLLLQIEKYRIIATNLPDFCKAWNRETVKNSQNPKQVDCPTYINGVDVLMSCAKCQHDRIVSQSRSSWSQPSYFRFFSEKLSFSGNIRDVSWADVRGENDLELINWFSHSHFFGSPQNADHADCRLQSADCADRANWVCFF